MTGDRSTPTCCERGRVDHDTEANRRPGLAPIQPIVSKHLDLQAQHAHERAGARGHHAAGDVEPSGAHFEIEARKKRKEHGVMRSLIAARHRHPSDIDDFATGFDDQPAGVLSGKRAGRPHEAARRDCPVAIPSKDVNRSSVVLITFAVIKAAITRIVVPTLFDDGLVTQAVRRVACFIVGQGEAILRAGENCLCEGVKRDWSLGRVAHLVILNCATIHAVERRRSAS
jgi:hypothetical protein